MKFLIGILLLIALVLWACAVYDINSTRIKKRYNHTFWLFLVLLFPLVGPITYFLLKRK